MFLLRSCLTHPFPATCALTNDKMPCQETRDLKIKGITQRVVVVPETKATNLVIHIFLTFD